MKEANKDTDISIGLLEFRPTEENFAKIGRMVWEVLNRPESRRKQTYKIQGKKTELHCQEVIVQGT
jgi:hypothetical protein